MKHTFYAIGSFLLAATAVCMTLLMTIPQVASQESAVTVDNCMAQIEDNLAKEQRLYRSIIYGEPYATGAVLGHVRYSTEGDSWIKTRENTWQSISPGLKFTIWSDIQMKRNAEFPQRRGILATKRTTTSELVPYLTQAMRTLQCRTEAVCLRADRSLPQESQSAAQVTVQPSGCIEYNVPTIEACHFASGEENLPQEGSVRTYCDDVVNAMLEREAELLKLAVQYDASYRSMLQFSGNFDLFLKELRWPLTNTLRQAAGLIGQFNRVPCFLGSCIDSDPDPE